MAERCKFQVALTILTKYTTTGAKMQAAKSAARQNGVGVQYILDTKGGDKKAFRKKKAQKG